MAPHPEPRTYSIWAVLAVLALVGIAGLVGLLVLGDDRSPTVQLPTRQTTTSTTEAPTTTTGPKVTVPGGAEAPEGVSEVVVADGTTSFAFATPPNLAQIPVRAVVPPVRVVPSEDGRSLTVEVSCAGGVGEALAQVSISVAPDTVTVLAVSLVPDGAPPCDPTGPPRTVVLPLAEPLGARSLVVVPAGTSVPTPAPG